MPRLLRGTDKMYLKDDNGFIEFKPISYEFPELSKTHKYYDQFDSNWLKIEFLYKGGDNIVKKETQACVLANEMTAFVRDLKILENGESSIAALDTLEPYLKISAERITNGYSVTVDFQGFIEERKEFEYICVKKMLTSDGMKEFIRQLEAEYKPFLQR